MCDFLLVINSNLDLILPHFRDIAGLPLRRVTAPLFHPNFRAFPLDFIADVVAPRSEDYTLIIHVITFELVQPVCRRDIDVIDRQTDGRTDGRLTIAIPRYSTYVHRTVKRITNVSE